MGAEAWDFQIEYVAASQEWHIIVAHGHASGSSCVDKVSCFEHHELAQVPNDVVDIEDHVFGVAVLTGDAIDREGE